MARLVILVATVMMCSVITVTALITSHTTAQKKCPHQEYNTIMTDHNPRHITITNTGADYSPFITDLTRKDVLTGQGPIINLTVEEALATIKVLHPLPIPSLQQPSIPIHLQTLWMTPSL